MTTTDAVRDRIHRYRDDRGMSIVEVMVTSMVLMVLLGMTFVSMELIQRVSTSVSSQYQEFQQALPAMAPFRSLVAAEVEPAPPVNGVPTPGFASLGNFAMTFYANVGTGYNNTQACPTGPSCTGTTAGPAKVVAQELDANGQPPTSCSAASPCSLQVRLYLPIIGVVSPGVSTCPGVSLTGTACQYSSSYRLLANVQNVVNDPSAVDGSGAPINPLFTYTLFDTTQNQAIQLTSGEVVNQMITGLTSSATYANPYPVDTQSLNPLNCAATSTNYPTTAIACPLDAVQSVTIHLMVGKPGTGTNGAVENSLIVYRYAQSPGASTSPYQYSAAVG